jgi:hypothetical protein
MRRPSQVLDHVPDAWPLRDVSPFVVRSLRKDLQRREEGQSASTGHHHRNLEPPTDSASCPRLTVLKAISASLNLRVIDRALEAFARCPPVVEDGPPAGEGDAEEKLAVVASEAEKAGVLRRLLDDVPRTIGSEALKERTTHESDELDEIA